MKESVYRRAILGDVAEFSGVFGLDTNSLIRIKEPSYSKDGISLTILSHEKDEVLLEANIEKSIADEWHKWKEPNFYDDNYHYFTHTPWWHDGYHDIGSTTFVDDNNGKYIIAKRFEKFNGDNRVYIELREKGNYTITVPLTSHVEVDLKSGTTYRTEHKNKISAFREKIKYRGIMINDKAKIIGKYPFKRNGFIRINQTKETETPGQLTISSHYGNYVEVEVMVKNISVTDNNINTPWTTNSDIDKQSLKMRYKDGMIIMNRYENFDSDNRICIELNTSEHYVISVPYDSCIETNLLNTNISYILDRRTSLSVDCKKVNKCGYSGYINGNRSVWSYIDYGSKSNPITSLVTDGFVELID